MVEHGRDGAPVNKVEAKIMEIWRDVFGIEELGRHDNFFDVGGHSLNAIQVASRMRDLMKVDVHVRLIFEAPTVAELADRVIALLRKGRQGREERPVLARVTERERAPLSPFQLFWWQRHLELPESPRLNYVEAYRIEGGLDRDAFRAAVEDAIARHDALRTTIEVEGGEPIQRVTPPRPGALEQAEVPDREAFDALLRTWREEGESAQRIRPFRVCLVRVGEDEDCLLMRSHRCYLDALLGQQFVNEVLALYDARVVGTPPPPEPEIQSIDFAHWSLRVAQTEASRTLIEELRGRIDGMEPVALPFDEPSPASVTRRFRPHKTNLDARFWDVVAGLVRAEATTAFCVLAGIYTAWLASLTKQSDILVVAPNELARGQDPRLDATFTCFFNYFLLPTDVAAAVSLRDVVRAVHKTVFDQEVEVPAALVTDTRSSSPASRAALNYIPAMMRPQSSSKAGLTMREIGTGPFDRMVDLVWLVRGQDGLLAASFDKFTEDGATALGASFDEFLARTIPNVDGPFRE